MRKRKNKQITKSALITAFIMIVAILFFYVLKMYNSIQIVDNYTAERTKQSTISEQNVEKQTEKCNSVPDLIENVTKSVCGISKLSNAGRSILSTATESELGLGTGIIVSEKGYILSNCHVTGEKYSTCYVTVEDKNTYTGTVVWSDIGLDLSIVKVNASNLIQADIGISNNVRIGQTVYAIGNPIGLEFRQTVTSGIISAVNRTIKIWLDRNHISIPYPQITIHRGNT